MLLANLKNHPISSPLKLMFIQTIHNNRSSRCHLGHLRSCNSHNSQLALLVVPDRILEADTKMEKSEPIFQVQQIILLLRECL